MVNKKRPMYVDDFLDLFYVASAGQDKAFVKTVEMVVEDTPTVDAVEVVHGRWITSATTWCEKAICSVCGEKILRVRNVDGYCYDDKPNYCPTAVQRWTVMGMNNALYHLCRHSVSIMDCWIPFPSTVLCKILGESLYQTRKKLKFLKEQGLVESVRYCQVTEDGNYLISGYKITEKAKSTPEYEMAWNEERKICKKVFGFDIGEVGRDQCEELFDDFCSYGETREVI